MIRQHIPKRVIGDPLFRWRGGDVSRIEGLTDMVFAFALTLLVVSLEVPRTFADLARVLMQAPAFAFSFAMLVMVWYFHYLFHRRFGFEDLTTFLLNAVLLFVILLYVYPLKFLATMLQGFASGDDSFETRLPDGGVAEIIASRGEMTGLMVIYSSGFVLIFGLFALMYRHAWKKRDELELDRVEEYLTRRGVSSHLVSCGVGVLSIALALLARDRPLFMASGMVYFLMWPLHALHDLRTRKTLRELTAP